MSNADLTGGQAQPASLDNAATDSIRMTLGELCLAHAVSAEHVVDMVMEGVLEPIGSTREEWRFTELHFHNAGIAVRLQRDLGINLPGVALALQLLQELQDMRQRLGLPERQPQSRRPPT